MVPVKGQPFVHALARREGLTMQSYFKNYEARLSASDEVEKSAFMSLKSGPRTARVVVVLVVGKGGQFV